MELVDLRRIVSETGQSQEFKKGHEALRVTSYLPGQQSQLLLMYLEAVHRSDFKILKHVFPAKLVASLFHIDTRYVGSRLKESVSKLGKTQIDIAPFVNGSANDYMFRNIFTKSDYVDGNFIFELNPDLAPIVVDTLKSFALVDREIFHLHNSDYGVNMYQYLSRFKKENQTWYERSIEELMFVFGIKDSKGKLREGKVSYAKPGKFVKHVLVRAIEDLHNSNEIRKLKFKEHVCKYTGETNLGIELVRKSHSPNSRIEKVIFHYEWVTDENSRRPETPDATIKRITLKGQALAKKGKKLKLEDIQELYQACCDINDEKRMRILEERIAELTKKDDDDEIEVLKGII